MSKKGSGSNSALYFVSHPNPSKVLLAQAEIEAPVIANLSLKLQQANVDSKIISVYETRRAEIPDRLFQSKKELMSNYLDDLSNH